MASSVLPLGATPSKNPLKTHFRVWAPRCSQVEVKILNKQDSRLVPMQRDPQGYFSAEVPGVGSGDCYFYKLNGGDERPDPVSRYQPEGVHGPSCVIDPDKFSWSDKRWKGVSFPDLIFYEMHVGTFTPAGTFETAIRKIPYLKKLGITCVEILPVAQFPGSRNWGYDGVGLFAVQNSYGGPDGLKKFVNACHRAGLAVCLDVVYNHLGPEGNYLHGYGPYFTGKYHTPWGDALNFDDRESGPVREFIIQNALFWLREYHLDVLRLDAVHGIFDFSAKHILQELNERVQGLSKNIGRPMNVIAESDLNDARLLRSDRQGGYGLAGQWSDDFHHAVHAYLTGERGGYYEDFGSLADIAKAIKSGFVYDGRYSTFRKRCHGNSTRGIPSQKFVTCIQNHDQVGNRAWGDRLAALVDFKKQKLAAALLLLSPNTPLLFMGEEYGEKRPFLYFIDHGDPGLVRAVREGRQREFESFGWKTVPDPKSDQTFLDSKLSWKFPNGSEQACLRNFYSDLIRLRKTRILKSRFIQVRFDEAAKWLSLEYQGPGKMRTGIVFSFSDRSQEFDTPFSFQPRQEVLHSESLRYGGKPLRARKHRRGQLALAPYAMRVVTS